MLIVNKTAGGAYLLIGGPGCFYYFIVIAKAVRQPVAIRLYLSDPHDHIFNGHDKFKRLV